MTNAVESSALTATMHEAHRERYTAPAQRGRRQFFCSHELVPKVTHSSSRSATAMGVTVPSEALAFSLRSVETFSAVLEGHAGG